MDIFLFGSLGNEFLVLRGLELPSFIDSAPSFEITSNLMDLPNLSDYDIDEHMPQTIDSRYFTLPDLSSLQLSSTSSSQFFAEKCSVTTESESSALLTQKKRSIVIIMMIIIIFFQTSSLHFKILLYIQ